MVYNGHVRQLTVSLYIKCCTRKSFPLFFRGLKLKNFAMSIPGIVLQLLLKSGHLSEWLCSMHRFFCLIELDLTPCYRH